MQVAKTAENLKFNLNFFFVKFQCIIHLYCSKFYHKSISENHLS